MISLVQQDLLIRLQKANCCNGQLASRLVDKIKIGASDVNCKLQELQVIQEMLEYLQCYRVLLEEVPSSGRITFDGEVGSVIRFKVGDDYISSNFTLVEGNEEDYPAVVLNINAYQDTFTASWNGTTLYMELEGPCDETDDIGIEVISGSVDVTLTAMDDGVCEVTESDNCLTEEQVQAMFSYIQRRCKICWQLPDSDYV